ncbi:MAG: hypothetical protein ABI488_22010 [Polyangiaceae bacterium]
MRRSSLLLAILATLPGCDDSFEATACFSVPATQTTCPGRDAVDKHDLSVDNAGSCGSTEIIEVEGDGRRTDRARPFQQPAGAPTDPIPTCCYPVKAVHHDGTCVTPGRPYFNAGQAVLAPLFASAGGCEAASSRAAAWASAGAAEHASVAAFARLALELMRLGAPNDLLRAAHQAALDEVGHADLCWALAHLLGGPRLRAAEFPLGELKLASSLAELAAATVREGCLAETLGAHLVDNAAQLATEPEIKAALTTIAAEEATHAVLSFRIVAWAVRVGGANVRGAVRAALAEPWPTLDLEELALRANVSASLLAAAAARGVTDVLKPAAARLLAA